MAESVAGVRHSILDLAPLELDCMNALWPLGEATVRDIQGALAETKPRAYTTIMTILDRLAQKGVVARRKAGRAWVYRPNLSAQEARSHALARIVDGFFEGSADALAAHLTTQVSSPLHLVRRPPGPRPPVAPHTQITPQDSAENSTSGLEKAVSAGLDTSLL